MKLEENRLQISMAAARVNARLTQEDVAKEMHVTKQTIVNWEKGRIRPGAAQLRMFCDICGISEDFIFLPKQLT